MWFCDRIVIVFCSSYLDTFAHDFLEDLQHGPVLTMMNTPKQVLRDMVNASDDQVALLERYNIVSFKSIQGWLL